ncbi:MAG: hypothetical protein J6M08_06140 [Methanobrevibacter sp.]|nr:hypothetical protein [Methanobrevibacter sp.]
MVKRNKKNKILRFQRNGLKPQTPKKQVINFPKSLEATPEMEQIVKDYLEEKGVNVYLSRIGHPLNLRIICSLLSEEILSDLIRDFKLNSFKLESEIRDHVGLYYFIT